MTRLDYTPEIESAETEAERNYWQGEADRYAGHLAIVEEVRNFAALRFVADYGQVILHRSTYHPGQYQASYLSPQGIPTGHTTHPDPDAAIMELLGIGYRLAERREQAT